MLFIRRRRRRRRRWSEAEPKDLLLCFGLLNPSK
jgi:hypothetical protein